MAEDHVSDDLAAHALGSLDDEDKVRVEAHLSVCDACRIEAMDYLRVGALLKDDIEPVEASPDIWKAIEEGIRQHQQRRTHRRTTLPWLPQVSWRFAAWAATAAVVFGLLAWNLDLQLGGDDNDVGNLAGQSDGTIVPLKAGNLVGPQPNGRLYVSEDGRQGGLAVVGMPQDDTGRVYEIWFIRRDQSRASGGLFQVDNRGQALVRVDIPGALAQFEGVGITQERGGGSAQPSGPDLISGPLYEQQKVP